MKKTLNQKAKIYSIYVFVFAILISVKAFTVEAATPSAKWIDLTIKHKNADSFYVKERKFIVNDKTKIFSYDNTRISFKNLWVPCKAKVYFITVNGNESMCLKIKVRSSLPKEVNNEVNNKER
jgi:hypothetical protein